MEFPVVDISGAEEARSRTRIAAEVDAACRRIGFLAVTGHGVPDVIVAAAWDAAVAFFDLSMAEKLAADRGDSPYGYMPFADEALAASRGGVALPDLKESFNLGPFHLPDTGVVWPDPPAGFREAWTAYYRAMEDLAGRLLSIFATALDVPADALARYFGRHTSALRALNYPALDRPAAPGQVRAGAHSDYGSLTILLPGPGRGGLEVQDRAGTWVPAPLVDGGFVVNIGDLMERWTNDRWVSTVHRVVNPPVEVAGTERRQSIAFFQNPDADAVIAPLPTCVPSGERPRYQPVVFGEWLHGKFSAATGGMAERVTGV